MNGHRKQARRNPRTGGAGPRCGWRGLIHVAVAAVAILAMAPVAGGQAIAAGSATITIKSYLDDGTTPLPFARFQITDSNGAIYGPLESAPPDGAVTFTVDTVDDSTTFEIIEETPPACGIAPDPVEVGPLADGEEISVDIATSFAPDCDLGSISIYAYSCPEGTDTTETDYAVFRDSCLETVDGTTYEISEVDGQESWKVVTGAYGISGRAPLVGLIPGDYLVAEKSDNPDESTETVVFCLAFTGTPGSSGDLPTVTQQKIGKDGVKLSLDGERIACDFFAAPSNGNDAEDPIPAETPAPDTGDSGNDVSQGDVDSQTASLEVHLSACPAGYDDGNYFEDCHGDGIEGRTVSIDGPGGFFDAMDTVLPEEPGPGIARFENLAAGDYLVAEDIPGDTATYFVYCSKADSEDVIDFTYDDSSSEAIWIELTDGLDVICDWYIIPDLQVETGKITVTKYTCPVGYDSDAFGDLNADCTDKTDGVTFTLSPQSGGSDREAVTGDSGDGRVRFTNLEPGNYDLWEDVPGEFSTPVVWCNLAGGSWYQKNISDFGGTTFDVDPGDDIRCSWFNLPEDLSGGGSLKIHKSICPDGLTSGYYATCYDDTLAGVTFVADGPGGYEKSKTTGDSGVVTFKDLSAGAYTVTELPPDGVHVAVYVVVCTRDGENYDFDYNDSTGLRINIKIPAGADIVCDWYNVPPAKEQPGAKGSITVIKSLCQGNKNNEYDWENDCENYGSGAEFDLKKTSNGNVVSGTTSNNGKLVFSGLANGAYSLDETNGDWCHAEADHVDASGNVLVQNGGNTNVYVYNCSKTVRTLPSTGSGPAPGAAGTGGTMAISGAASLLGIVLLRRVQRPRPAYVAACRAA